MSYKVELRHAAQKELDALLGQDYEAVAKAISALDGAGAQAAKGQEIS